MEIINGYLTCKNMLQKYIDSNLRTIALSLHIFRVTL